MAWKHVMLSLLYHLPKTMNLWSSQESFSIPVRYRMKNNTVIGCKFQGNRFGFQTKTTWKTVVFGYKNMTMLWEHLLCSLPIVQSINMLLLWVCLIRFSNEFYMQTLSSTQELAMIMIKMTCCMIQNFVNRLQNCIVIYLGDLIFKTN